MLQLQNATLFIGSKALLADANALIEGGARIGIVGRNGCGKSHLIEILSGELPLDGGLRVLQNNPRVLLVKQELPDDNISPMEYLRLVDDELQRLNSIVEDQTTDPSLLGDLYGEIGAIEEERYEKLAPIVLRGLGLKEQEYDAPMKNLSGGYRMRIGLAAALIQQPDLLLMDEPTNHLDLESTLWLTSFLQSYPAYKAVVIVSHDTNLLNELTTSIWHLKGGNINVYGGNYDVYRRESEIQLARDIDNNTKIAEQIKDKLEFYHTFRQRPARAAQAMDRLRHVEVLKLQKVEIVAEQPVAPIVFNDPGEIGYPFVDIQEASIGYGQEIILSNINLSLQYGVKVGLLGRNGQGKSSLIKAIVGKLNPKNGQILLNSRLKIGYFSQELTDELDITKTVIAQYSDSTSIRDTLTLRKNLLTFGFGADYLGNTIQTLSGGEKSRLAFAIICAREPHLIVLDEPTNHLDVETREVLVEAIKQFNGSVLLVSHDWELHSETMEKFWVVNKGNAVEYKQNLENYKRALFRFLGYQTYGKQKEAPKAKSIVPCPGARPAASQKNKVAKTKQDKKPTVAKESTSSSMSRRK